MRILLLFSFYFILGYCKCQNVSIIGKALGKGRVGKEICLLRYADLITKTRIKEAVDTIKVDGSFQLKTDVFQVQAVEIQIGNEIAKLYIEPYYQYAVYFPEMDTIQNVNKEIEFRTDLIIYGDSTELNARIIDFNTQFDEFWGKNYESFVTHSVQKDLDSFRLKIRKRYEKVNHKYFKNYVDYSFAVLYENTGMRHLQLARDYFYEKPILYSNYEFMEFFNQFFTQYLKKRFVTENGEILIAYINEQPDLQGLKANLKSDPLLKNDSLAELVILKNLFELYYVPGFSKKNIISLIEEISGTTANKQHQLIGKHILQVIHLLEAGEKAPNFTMRDKNGNFRTLSDFNGKYIYVMFFSMYSTQSIQELRLIEKLNEKHGKDLVFISICVEENRALLLNFLKKNKKYNWIFLQAENCKQVREAYNVKAVPLAFFIGKDGNLLSSPSPLPSEGIEQKLNQIFKR